MNLSIGCAQFGMNYGISNTSGQTSPSEVKKIVEYCRDHNIQYFDTAPAYDKSEEVLGKALKECQFLDSKISTKLIHLSDHNGTNISGFLQEGFVSSLQKLNVQQVEVLFVHNLQDMFGKAAQDIYDFLLLQKDLGKISKIGISIYSFSEYQQLKEKGFRFDVVQVPINVFDQRLLENSGLKMIKDDNCELHARSIFLQGLLLMNSIKNKPYFKSVYSVHSDWRNFLAMNKLQDVLACIDFVKGQGLIDLMVLGVNNLAHVQDAHRYFSKESLGIDYKKFSVSDEKIVEPRYWQVMNG